ncbi:hypothetical protein D3C76_1307460 [compost metagenome]
MLQSFDCSRALRRCSTVSSSRGRVRQRPKRRPIDQSPAMLRRQRSAERPISTRFSSRPMKAVACAQSANRPMSLNTPSGSPLFSRAEVGGHCSNNPPALLTNTAKCSARPHNSSLSCIGSRCLANVVYGVSVASTRPVSNALGEKSMGVTRVKRLRPWSIAGAAAPTWAPSQTSRAAAARSTVLFRRNGNR